jgi:hypothetical protein
MAKDLYSRRLNATTAFFRQAESMFEPSYKEKMDMAMAQKKEMMETELDFYIKKQDIADRRAIDMLRKQNEIRFNEFQKMEDEKYRRQKEMYKDGELIALQMAHETQLATLAHSTQQSLLKEQQKEEATKRVTETPTLEASLLPGDITPKKRFGLLNRAVGSEALGIFMNAKTVLDTGNQIMNSVEPVISDLQLAYEDGVDVKSNYLYKRTYETVDSALSNLSNEKIARRFRKYKTPEQQRSLQLQIQELTKLKNNLLQMTN